MSFNSQYQNNPNKRKYDDLYINSPHNDSAYNNEHPSKRHASDSNNINYNGNHYVNYNDDVQPLKQSNQQQQQQIPVQHLEYTKPQAPLYNLRQYQRSSTSPPSTPQPLSTPTVTQNNTPRDAAFHYVNEIANYSADDVKLAMSSRIDDETGEIYGSLGEYKCGYMFNSFSELIASGVHKTNPNSPLLSYHEEEVVVDNQKVFNIKPASSLLVYDTDDHDDRGNIILFNSPYKVQIPSSNVNTTPIADRGNKALVKNIQGKIAVRVIRGKDNLNVPVTPNRWVPQSGYRYDGLYFVADFWYEKYNSNDTMTTWSFIFKLVRIYGQPSLPSYNSVVMTQQQPIQQPRVIATEQTAKSPFPYNTGLNESPPVTGYPQSRQTAMPSYQSMPTYTPSPQQPQYSSNPPSNTSLPAAPSNSSSLNHDTIKQMLQDLRSKNNSFNQRMQQYDKNIRELSKKSNIPSDAGSEQESKKIVTSRNKDFFWKLNGDASSSERPSKPRHQYSSSIPRFDSISDLDSNGN